MGISRYQDIRRYQEDDGVVIPNEDKGGVSPAGATTLDTTFTTLCRRLPRPRFQPSTVKHLGRIQLIEVRLYYSKLGRVVRGSQSHSEAYGLLRLVLIRDRRQGGGLPVDQ